MTRLRIFIILTLFLLNCFSSEDANSQVFAPRFRPANRQISPYRSQPEISVLKEQSRWLKKAKASIDSENYEAAIEIIHRRLLFTKRGNSRKSRFISEDVFLDSQMKKNLKKSVNELLKKLPEKGQRFYSAQYDQIARANYEEGLKFHNYQAVGEVVRTYFNTPSGFDACLQLANHHFDHARWVAASLLYQELKEHRLFEEKWSPALSIRLAVCYWQLGMEKKLQGELNYLSERIKKNILKLPHQKISLT